MKPEPEKPNVNQESVWDYPRPPRVEATSKRIRVVFNGVTIADTTRAQRVLETSHPPTYYIPLQDVKLDYLVATERRTVCEFKGAAYYWSVIVDGKTANNAVWGYLNPAPGFEALKNHVAFYASKMDACYVDDERVQAQPGDFYGGWITANIVGPFKGGPGTRGW